MSLKYTDKEINSLPNDQNGMYFIIDNADQIAAKNLLWKNLKPCYIYSSHIINTQIPYWLFGLSSNVDNVTINPHFIKISFL